MYDTYLIRVYPTQRYAARQAGMTMWKFDIDEIIEIIQGGTLTSGPMTNATNGMAIMVFTHISQRRKVKCDATPEPKCDSISLIRNSQGIRTVRKLTVSRFQCSQRWDAESETNCNGW